MSGSNRDVEELPDEAMVLEQARVEAVTDEGAWLEAGLSGGCANCRDGRGCGVSVFQRLFRLPRHRVWLPTTEPLSVGDVVVVGLSQRALLRASLWLYLSPLLGLLTGAIVMDSLFGHEALTAAGAASGLFGALLAVNSRQRRQARSGEFFPVLREIVFRQA
ncbi:MAG: SoxR reducing system RseC family protein [Pseudomonadota bacterium]